MQEKKFHTLENRYLEAKRTIDALRTESANYQQISESMHAGVMVFDTAGSLRHSNVHAQQLTGYDQRDWMALSLQDLVPEFSTEGHPSERLINHATTLHHKNGDLVSVRISTGETMWNGETAKMVTFTEIPEEPAISPDRQKGAAVLTAMIETTSDMIAALDEKNRVLFANAAFRHLIRQLYGKELKPTDYITALLPDERKKFWENTIRETRQSGRRRFDLQYYLKDQRYDVEWSTSRVRDDKGSLIAVGLFGREITSRRVAEERLRERDAQLHHAQKLEAVGTLASGIAHEFNNALSIVLGNLELAAMDIYADLPVRPYVEDAKAGILRAKKVVRQLLDFSKKSEGKQQKVDLHTVTANALSLLRASIPTHIEFHQLIHEGPPVMADPSHLHQLVVNLCTGSAEIMDKDGGVLTVTLEYIQIKKDKAPKGTSLEPGLYAKLTVADTGSGIHSDDSDRDSTIETDRGKRLGLSMAHGIVKSYSGDIVVGRVLGSGIKYEIYLPTMPQPNQEVSVAPDPTSLTGNERVLLVDDEPKFVMVTQKQLEYLGYHVEIFTSAISALKRFKETPDTFDLVITDVAMPKMDGEKLISQIRLLRPDIPAILCTGYSNKVDRKTATQLGCEFIIKPVERDHLVQLIRETLDKAPAG